MPTRNIDEELGDWNSLRSSESWESLLLGNGASIAISRSFVYSSIYAEATSENIDHPISSTNQELFQNLSTQNFEQVLSSLSTARKVNSVLRLATTQIDRLYQNVQQALIEAVHRVHVPWVNVPDSTRGTIRSELLEYENVFSTNYDLLIYWAMMHTDNGSGFIDYFFSGSFDPGNTENWSGSTSVHFLHGGLHLNRLITGETVKRSAGEGQNLLDMFAFPLPDGVVPLFVTEGTSQEKMTSINRSSYLSFAYNQLAHSKESCVIFGHSLSESDRHIVDAIARWQDVRLAISMLPDSPENIISNKARIVHLLPRADIKFFDATTHPLGFSSTA